MLSFIKKSADYQIVLGSASPRRKELLKGILPNFSIQKSNVEEVYGKKLKREEIPLFLSQIKANSFTNLNEKSIIITCDTIVWHKDKSLEKAENAQEAKKMLEKLSDSTHEVITGVTVKSNHQSHSFYDVTKVTFGKIKPQEIEYYIKNFEPYDKAGAYGIQEWIGYIGVKSINGCFYNVMGLPLRPLYKVLNEKFIL
jgi:septum formation protein